MGFIYKITNTINNKAYIGITTKTPEERWRAHLNAIKTGKGCPLLRSAVNKHGADKFKIETLIICFDDDLYRFEKDYIKKYNTLAPNGYNAHEGGECGGNFTGKTHSQETKEKIGIISHKLHSEMTTEQKTHLGRLISNGIKNSIKFQEYITRARLDRLNGNITYAYLSIPKSEETKRKISKSVKEYFNTSDPEVNKSRKNTIINALVKANGRKVEQYSLQNILIKTYNSIVESSKETKIGTRSIQANASGRSKTAGGFIWKYVSSTPYRTMSDEFKEKQRKIITKVAGRKVEQYSLDNKLIKVYDSIAEASRQTKTAPSTIREVALGKGKTAGGFIWRFPTNEPKEETPS